jgi:hypothetical protein
MNKCIVCGCKVKLSESVYVANGQYNTCSQEHADQYNGQYQEVPTLDQYNERLYKRQRRWAA